MDSHTLISYVFPDASFGNWGQARYLLQNDSIAWHFAVFYVGAEESSYLQLKKCVRVTAFLVRTVTLHAHT